MNRLLDKLKIEGGKSTKEEITSRELLINKGIDLERLKNQGLKYLDFNELKEDKVEYALVDFSEIIGTSRSSFFSNWYDFIDDLHKVRTVERLLSEEHEVLKQILKKDNDLPELYSINSEYYISGNGKHRIIIGKCLEIEEIFAKITYYKEL